MSFWVVGFFCAKLQAKNEVLRKFLLGPQLAQVRSLGRSVIINHDLPVLGRIAPITGFNLSVKTLGGLVLPTRQVLAGNERKKSWFQLKRVGLSRTGKEGQSQSQATAGSEGLGGIHGTVPTIAASTLKLVNERSLQSVRNATTNPGTDCNPGPTR